VSSLLKLKHRVGLVGLLSAKLKHRVSLVGSLSEAKASGSTGGLVILSKFGPKANASDSFGEFAIRS
jgi:hypothetical protein